MQCRRWPNVVTISSRLTFALISSHVAFLHLFMPSFCRRIKSARDMHGVRTCLCPITSHTPEPRRLRCGPVLLYFCVDWKYECIVICVKLENGRSLGKIIQRTFPFTISFLHKYSLFDASGRQCVPLLGVCTLITTMQMFFFVSGKYCLARADGTTGVGDVAYKGGCFCVEWCLVLVVVARMYGGKVSVATG